MEILCALLFVPVLFRCARGIITLTKQAQLVDTGAVPPVCGAGAPETNLTEEMIAAGARLIAEEWGVVGADIAADLARDVSTSCGPQSEIILIVCPQKWGWTISRKNHRPRAELIELLKHHRQALAASCTSYDSGNEWEAARLATTVFTLVHDGGSIISLLTRPRLRP